MNYAFADFILDSEKAELRQNGEPVRVEPQVFDLLKLLVSSDGRMVTRDEIFEAIWGNRIVSDAALSSRIKDARKALGDSGSAQKFIKTVQRRGLRFVADVTSLLPSEQAAPAAVPKPMPQMRTPEQSLGRISVAVLPFEDLGADDLVSPLSRALTDELTVVLAYWRTFKVVSRQSVARLGDDLGSARDVGEALDADYLLHGSFRTNDTRIKLRVSLTQVSENTDVWTDRLVCDLDEFLDLEEELSARLSTIIAPEIQSAEARRITRIAREDWSPWDMSMRAFSLLHSARRTDFEEAEAIAKEASAMSPDWGLPFTLVAIARFQMAMTGFSGSDTSRAFHSTLGAAREALEIDRGDWLAHALTAVGELWTNRNHALARSHVEKAISLNPNAALNHHFGGCITGFSGDVGRAIALQERLFRIDPTYPYRAVIEADLGLWHMMDGNFDAAEERLDRSALWDPSYGRALQRKIAFCGLTGDRDTARAAAAKLLDFGLPTDVDTIMKSYPFQRADHRETFQDGLQRAGLN